MRREFTAAGALALLLGCASRSPGPERAKHDLGSPSDMLTALGPHDGYVVGKCTVRETRYVYVKGTGSERLLADDYRTWSPVAMEQLRDIAAGVGHGSGFGRGCENGGLIVWVESWRLMDRAIESAGDGLVRANLSDVVTFGVESIPIVMAD